MRPPIEPDYSRPRELNGWQSALLMVLCGWGLIAGVMVVAMWLVGAW